MSDRAAFRRVSSYLKERFGERVHKVCLHCGFSCPNRDGTVGVGGCTFCSGPALQPVGYDPAQTVAEQLRLGMEYIRGRHGASRFIAYFQDGSATYAPLAVLRERFAPVMNEPAVVALAVSTRPDCVSRGVLDLLAEVRPEREVWLELGLQIADDALLASLNRGHDVDAFREAVRRCQRRDLAVVAHVILGLPGASPELEAATARLLAELGVWGVKLHAFHVIRGTEMARRHAAGGMRLLSREEYVARVVAFLELLPRETVVHRVTAESPPRLTVAPAWTTNKMAAYDAVVDAFHQRRTWQGRRAAGDPQYCVP